MYCTEDLKIEMQGATNNKGNLKGMNGLWEGYVPRMLNVKKLCTDAWDQLEQITIQRCWVKAKYVPCDIETELVSVFCRMCNSKNSKETKSMIECF